LEIINKLKYNSENFFTAAIMMAINNEGKNYLPLFLSARVDEPSRIMI